MSERRRTPRSVVLPSAIRHAAMIGSELFLLPLISTLPLRRLPPRTMKCSIWPFPGPLARNALPAKNARQQSFGSIGHSIGRRSIDLPDQLTPDLSVENRFPPQRSSAAGATILTLQF